MIFLDGGMPKAVAIVSPENEGSKTTRPPWTPLSVDIKKVKDFKLILFYIFVKVVLTHQFSGQQFRYIQLIKCS